MLIEETPSKLKRVGRMLRLKCPKCGQTKVFYRAKFPGARPKIKETCEHCGYRFGRHEGYFRGAVYLSYGMTIVEGILAFLLAKVFIFGLSNRDLFFVAVGAMLFFSIWNYKLARVVWLNWYPEDSKT